MSGRETIPDLLGTKKRAILFLRWVVIIATSYLLLFGPAMSAGGTAVPLFIALFLATNLLAGAIPERAFEQMWLQGLLVAADTLFISFGMVLSGGEQTDLFLLYFSVLFLAALGENLAMIAGGCALINLLYLLVLLKTQPLAEVLTPAVLIRIPFLFGIGIFYGYLVERTKVERNRAELALEHERFRSDFLATITHDLQSPLSAIAGFVDLLLQAPPLSTLGEFRRIFDAIKRGSNESSELIANFLALARGEAKPRQIRRQTVDVNAVAAEVLSLHSKAAADKDIDLTARLAEGLPPISGDRVQIRRAVSNLVANAVKFTPQRGQVEVRTALDLSAVTLTVADNGPGIPEDVQKQLFERYARGNTDEVGSGLGLFITRLVAEAHGGSVTVRSNRLDGSRFTLRLPLPGEIPTVLTPVSRASI